MRISDWSSDVCSSDLCSTGLVATEGFSDVTEIGNERKYDLYDLNIERAPPLVERRMRGEISARTDATGQELTSVNADQVRTVVGRLVQEGAKSIAVCLLHSYASAAHERQVRDIIAAAFPSVDITLSRSEEPKSE